MLASIFDSSPMGFGPSSSIIGDGARKFESARSRYQRLQVPFSQVKWIVCDQCGDVVSRMDYKEHVTRHEVIHLAHQLYYFEIGEERKEQERIEQIQRQNDKARKRAERKQGYIDILGLSSSSSTSSSSNSSSNSSDDSDYDSDSSYSSRASSRSVSPEPLEEGGLPDQMDFSAPPVVIPKKRGRKKKMAANMKAVSQTLKTVGTMKKRGRKRKREVGTPNWLKNEVKEVSEDENNENEDRTNAAIKGGGKASLLKGRKPMVKGRSGNTKGDGIMKKTNNNKAAPMRQLSQAELEHRLCQKYLGPKYDKVFIDLRKQRDYIAAAPNEPGGSHQQRGKAGTHRLENISSPPVKLRRSLRGAFKLDFADEDTDLVALL